MSNNRLICSIYRSSRKQEMYLYVAKGQDMQKLPEELMKYFGRAEHVMDLLLREERSLARVDVLEVIEKIAEQDFFLQMPPSPLEIGHA